MAAKGNVVHPLLLHAKLYVFANMYLIKPLNVSAKQKMIDLFRKLGNLLGGNERAAVFDVLANTLPRLPEDHPLLHWLSRYASWRLEELRQMPTRFEDLIPDEESDFAKILIRCVLKSPVDPFNLSENDVILRYPIPTAEAHYDPWRGF